MLLFYSNTKESIWPVVIQLDITKSEDIIECENRVHKDFGGVDILISNAGVSQRGSVIDTKDDVHINLMNINYFGPVRLIKGKFSFGS